MPLNRNNKITPKAAPCPKDLAMSMATSRKITMLTRGISMRISHHPGASRNFQHDVAVVERDNAGPPGLARLGEYLPKADQNHHCERQANRSSSRRTPPSFRRPRPGSEHRFAYNLPRAGFRSPCPNSCKCTPESARDILFVPKPFDEMISTASPWRRFLTSAWIADSSFSTATCVAWRPAYLAQAATPATDIFEFRARARRPALRGDSAGRRRRHRSTWSFA